LLVVGVAADAVVAAVAAVVAVVVDSIDTDAWFLVEYYYYKRMRMRSG